MSLCKRHGKPEDKCYKCKLYRDFTKEEAEGYAEFIDCHFSESEQSLQSQLTALTEENARLREALDELHRYNIPELGYIGSPCEKKVSAALSAHK